MTERLAGPRFAQHFDDFFGSTDTLLAIHAKGFEIARLIGDARGGDKAAFGCLIDDRDIFGEPHRMIERCEQHTGADLDAFGAHADQARHQHGCWQVAVFLLMMFGKEEAIETCLFADFGLFDDLVDQAGNMFAFGWILGAREIADR